MPPRMALLPLPLPRDVRPFFLSPPPSTRRADPDPLSPSLFLRSGLSLEEVFVIFENDFGIKRSNEMRAEKKMIREDIASRA